MREAHRLAGLGSSDALHTPQRRRIATEMDVYGLLSAGDPPMFPYSQAKDVPPGDPDYVRNHHRCHMLALRREADAVGVLYET